MTESTGRRVVVDESAEEPKGAAQAWRAPTLTVLGDATELTTSGGFTNPDGPGSIS